MKSCLCLVAESLIHRDFLNYPSPPPNWHNSQHASQNPFWLKMLSCLGWYHRNLLNYLKLGIKGLRHCSECCRQTWGQRRGLTLPGMRGSTRYVCQSFDFLSWNETVPRAGCYSQVLVPIWNQPTCIKNTECVCCLSRSPSWMSMPSFFKVSAHFLSHQCVDIRTGSHLKIASKLVCPMLVHG